MKKIISLVLCLMLLLSMSAMAFASGTTTVTTVVPEPTYTLTVPADLELPFGTIRKYLGNVSVKDASGFAVGKGVLVTVTYDGALKSDNGYAIPYTLNMESGSEIYFCGMVEGNVDVTGSPAGSLTMETLGWGKVPSGVYSTTITFTSEVVIR